MAENKAASERRIMWLSAAASVVVHAWVLGLPLDRAQGPAAAASGPLRATQLDSPNALRLLRLGRVGEARSPAIVVDLEAPSSATAFDEAAAEPVVAVAESEVPEPDPRSAPGTLAPRLRDARLWALPTRRPTRDQRWEDERLSVRDRATEANRARAAPKRAVGMSDWVRGDGDDTWGLSPGRIHLGSRSLRTCGGADAAGCGFGLPPNRVGEYARWVQRYDAIQAQSARFDFDEHLEARARAIRERRDSQREDTIGVPRR